MANSTPFALAGFALVAAVLQGCGTDAFRIAPIAPENLQERYVSAEYGTAGEDAYTQFRAGQIGCPELARRGWSNDDLFAVGCPAN